VAKITTTLDHISDGRAVLGIGGAWFEREHEAYGIPFPPIGERLDRLDESVMLIRRLLDGERFSHEGRFYTFKYAQCNPRPVQSHHPILVGGSGPKKTLRTVALRADGWNTSGTLEEVRAVVDILEEHCADVGRDISTIERTVSFPIVLRDDRAAAEAAYGTLLAHNGIDSMQSVALLGSPTEVADAIRPYAALGFETVIVRMPAPYDRETIERMPRVAELLDG
jgi:alkanesulfonate monooxygenase SsuD/methylene tetrahydromethanopterin reductase-like flavin-dependent oxidoreductase (luciferase family)